MVLLFLVGGQTHVHYCLVDFHSPYFSIIVLSSLGETINIMTLGGLTLRDWYLFRK